MCSKCYYLFYKWAYSRHLCNSELCKFLRSDYDKISEHISINLRKICAVYTLKICLGTLNIYLPRLAWIV